ncbi:hypothetical protein BLOT_014153, partial [Blomia tropicalis]
MKMSLIKLTPTLNESYIRAKHQTVIDLFMSERRNEREMRSVQFGSFRCLGGLPFLDGMVLQFMLLNWRPRADCIC